jgi:hypothetical protein
MNSRSSSPRRYSGPDFPRSSRASFSPIRRTLAVDPLARFLEPLGQPDAHDRSTPGGTPRIGERLWNPTLLDRLQSPLTRYHE